MSQSASKLFWSSHWNLDQKHALARLLTLSGCPTLIRKFLMAHPAGGAACGILEEERSRKLLRFERKYVVISRRDACSHSFASRSFAFLESLQTTITENFNCAKFGCTPTIALVCMIRKYDFVTDRSWSYSGISRECIGMVMRGALLQILKRLLSLMLVCFAVSATLSWPMNLKTHFDDCQFKLDWMNSDFRLFLPMLSQGSHPHHQTHLRQIASAHR